MSEFTNVQKFIDKLLDDIEWALKARSKTIGDLARELTSKEHPNGRSYNQVYDWVRLRKFNPRAVALLELQAWRDANKSMRAHRVSDALATITKTS